MSTTPALLKLGPGLSDKGLTAGASLGEGSVNFYPDPGREGYLQSYSGRSDHFLRDTKPGQAWGTPPVTDTDITRIKSFIDARGQEHIVFVQGPGVYVVRGNGYEHLRDLVGQNFEGKYYPDLIIHEGKLLVANSGDPILVWDGEKDLHPLGVLETPLPPDPRVSEAPLTDFVLGGTNTPGTWEWVGHWWPQEAPGSGPAENLGADGTTPVNGFYQLQIQFVDSYGNRSRVSPASAMVDVPPPYKLNPAATDKFARQYLYADFTPPLQDAHVADIIIGRTLNQNPDGGLGLSTVFHEEARYLNTTMSRITCTMVDSALASQDLLDAAAQPPPSARGIASWGKRVWWWGTSDDNEVGWSDIGYFGQTRGTNSYRAHSQVTRVIGANDRILVLSRTASEVLYEGQAGIAVLSQDFGLGSSYGRSFVQLGERALGLWDKGFGIYDGRSYEWLPTPHWLQGSYLDRRFFVSSAEVWNDFYVVSIQKDHVGTKNNYLLVYDLLAKEWYLQQESVYDLTTWRGALLGCDDSIYECFKGNTPNAPVLQFRDFLPQGASPAQQRSLVGVQVLGENSSSSNLQVEITTSSWLPGTSQAQGLAIGSRETVNRVSAPLPYWDQPALRYDSQPAFSGGKDVWLTPDIKQGVAGFAHDIKLTWAAGAPVRVKALLLNYTADREVRK